MRSNNAITNTTTLISNILVAYEPPARPHVVKQARKKNIAYAKNNADITSNIEVNSNIVLLAFGGCGVG